MRNIKMRVAYPNELWHYGVKGMKWGVRRGPPYPIEKQIGKTRRFETVTSDGVKVTSLSSHGQDRALDETRNISDQAIVEALHHPLDVGEVRIDEKGRPSKRYIGYHATVNVNPDTGVITTVWPTNDRIRRKVLNKGKE